MKQIESLLIDLSNAIDEADLHDDDRRVLDGHIDAALRYTQLLRRCVDVDEAYERAAARSRSNDFAETGGKDWT
jgi:hypothetical protein